MTIRDNAEITATVIRRTENALLQVLPYLAPAIVRLEKRDALTLLPGSVDRERAVRPLKFETDGRRLYYDPDHIAGRSERKEYSLAREYLHTLLHCLFRHPYNGIRCRVYNMAAWNLACDIQVEVLIDSLGIPMLGSTGQSSTEDCRKWSDDLETAIGKPLTAQRIYPYLLRNRISETRLEEGRRLFYSDDHRLWGDGADYVLIADADDSEDMWEDAARESVHQINEMEENTPLYEQLSHMRRIRVRYEDIIMRFMNSKETLRSADEFDYIYYTYGMKLYGNLPLIEPLEYDADERLREFVIAIDTSGSVQGRAVRSFIRETCKLLLARDILEEHTRIHILQCDDRIRDDAVIRDAADADIYLAGLRIQGKGRTDFRPVFEYADEMLSTGQWREVQGLVYYTDGLGQFPETPAPYQTAFILSRETADVPPWAVSYVLSAEELAGMDD